MYGKRETHYRTGVCAFYLKDSAHWVLERTFLATDALFDDNCLFDVQCFPFLRFRLHCGSETKIIYYGGSLKAGIVFMLSSNETLIPLFSL